MNKILKNALTIILIIIGIINIIMFIYTCIKGFVETIKEYKTYKSSYHFENGEWHDSYGNKIIPKSEQ